LRDVNEAGEIYCRDSIRFRSFEDDLLDVKHWKNKVSTFVYKLHFYFKKNASISELEIEDECQQNQITSHI